MTWLKRILIAIFLLLVIGLILGWFYVGSITPDYSESRALTGLNAETEVLYDTYGVPHIYAESNVDAYRTLGYVHAKDRLWQMELLRRIAPGRLSEILGPATVETDKFFRHMQISKTTDAAVARYKATTSDELRACVNAYLDGINSYVDSDETPIEFTVLGIDKTTFDIYDIHNIMGYMAFSFAMAHKTEPVVSHISERLGSTYLKALDIHVDTSTTMIKSHVSGDLAAQLSTTAHDVMYGLPHPALIGSNSWVLSGDLTASGEVIFANDPHIGFSQPSVWYEAHIETPELSFYGNHLAGYPFAVMGHTADWAVGLTMYENDDIDFYRERVDTQNRNTYYHNRQWKPIETAESTIVVKGGTDIHLTLRSTEHGPVVSDETMGFDSSEVVTMWWTFQQKEIDLLKSLYMINTAQKMEDVQAGAALISAPGLNVMYGDKAGNIAWWAAAHRPIRPDHVNSKLILNGTGEDDILGYYDFEENPMAINPPWGYVYSANNQSVRTGAENYPGYFLPEDRAQRIVQLIKAEDQWDVYKVKMMLLDQTNNNSADIAQHIATVLKAAGISDEGQQSLASWDGSYDDKSISPIIYVKMQLNLLKDIMIDELGEDMFTNFKKTHLAKRCYHKLFTDATHPWWDDTTTAAKESQQDIITRAYERSLSELKTQLGADLSLWRWSSLHTLEHVHTLGANEMLRPYFNVGPYEVTSSNEVINNLLFHLDEDGTYEVHGGPSCRRIVDFADVSGNSWSILPTGQSGRVKSAHYKDQADMYVAGEYRRKLINRADIEQAMTNRSVFRVSE